MMPEKLNQAQSLLLEAIDTVAYVQNHQEIIRISSEQLWHAASNKQLCCRLEILLSLYLQIIEPHLEELASDLQFIFDCLQEGDSLQEGE